MTHEELLERIDAIDEPCLSNHNLTSIIRAVVEYHEPFEFTWGEETNTACFCGEMYPCPTIQAIEKELK